MSKKLLTLNIGASTVELAEYESNGKSLTLTNYGTATLAAPLDSGNAETILSPAILEIVREKGIKPGKTAITLSGQMVFPRVAAIPGSGSGDKFEQLVRYEVEQNVPFPIDEMVCDRAVLGDTPGGDKSVMIVAAKIEQVEAVTDAVTALGFTPEIVDVAPVALANLVAASGGGDECHIILDIGAKTTSLVIREGEKLYNRSIPVAGNTVTKEIAQLLGCTLEEAEGIKRESAYVSLGGVTEDEDETLDRISKTCRAVMTRLHAEISRSINFYRSQQQGGVPARLYLTGGSSLLPQTLEFFAESLQMEVQYLDPFAAIGVGGAVDAERVQTDAMQLAATAGAALHAAGLAGISINLMPPSVLEARAEVAKIPFVAAGSALAVAAFGCWLFASMSDTARIEEEVEAVSAEANRLEGVQRRIDKAAGEEADAFAAATNLAVRLHGRGAEAARLKTVAAALESGLWIAKWSETVEKTQVEDPNARGADRTREVETPVVRVTVRGWKNDVRAILAREAAAPAREAAQEGGEAASGESDAPKAAPRRVSRRNLTAGLVVANRLENSGAVVPGSVRIVDDRSYGKDGCLEQFVVQMQFKEPECK